jgi:endonuclease YncB( thermonuclease family)
MRTWLRSRAARAAPLWLVLAVGVSAALIGVHRPVVAWASAVGGPGQDLQVIDGDTLQSDGEIIQLYGIDAPELGQTCLREDEPWPCGVEAALALQKLVTLSGQPVICKPWKEGGQTDGPNGELVRVCELGDDQDLSLAMLGDGYAVALPGSFPDYGEVERKAKEAGLGIWGSQFTLPSEWRAGQRTAGKADEPTDACNIKGTLRGDNQRIYVVPTDKGYEATTLDPARGERLFCSDEEARRAGWRRAGENPAQVAR